LNLRWFSVVANGNVRISIGTMQGIRRGTWTKVKITFESAIGAPTSGIELLEYFTPKSIYSKRNQL
jgi:hypothetical protein